jgi:hypothetical protein
MVSGKKVEIVDHVREQAKRATGKEIRVSLANSYDYRYSGNLTVVVAV